MPTQATIAITPGTGQLLDAVSLVIGLNTVVRETMVIADPTSATQLAGVTVGGALKVDASATTQPISGTVAISGTVPVSGTVSISGSVAVTGTFWQATQPVSLAAPVTVAQATAANLNATVVGTGAFVVQATLAAETTKVIGTVNQGSSPWVVSNAGIFAVQEATLDAALVAQEATTSGVKGLTAFGAVTTAAPTYTTGKSDALSLDTAGNLRVSLKDSPANTNSFLVTATIAASQTIEVTNAGIFAVQATLSAETTKVIGTIRVTGNIGGVMDAVLGATKPANVLQVGGNDGTNAYGIPLASGGTSVVVSGTVSTSSTNATTGNAPTAASVGVTSALALALNLSRKGLILTNTSSNFISIAFGANAAVLNSGVTLAPYGTYEMDAFNFTTAAVNAIASGAASNLGIQEWQ